MPRRGGSLYEVPPANPGSPTGTAHGSGHTVSPLPSGSRWETSAAPRAWSPVVMNGAGNSWRGTSSAFDSLDMDSPTAVCAGGANSSNSLARTASASGGIDLEVHGTDAYSSGSNLLSPAATVPLNKWTLSYLSAAEEADYRLYLATRFVRSLQLRGLVNLGLMLVIIVPVIQQAAHMELVPVATFVVSAVSLAWGLAGMLSVSVCTPRTLAKWWNVFVYFTNIAVVVPMFLVLMTCVLDGIAPNISQCTPTYQSINPLLPMVLACMSPYMVTTLTQASWYVTVSTAGSVWIVAVVCAAVAKEPSDTVTLVALFLLFNSVLAASVGYVIERSGRTSRFLNIVYQKSVVALLNSERQRTDQERMNKVYMAFAANSQQVLYQADRDGNFTAIAESAAHVYGVPAASLFGQPHTTGMHLEDVARVREAIADLWQSNGESLNDSIASTPSVPLVLQFRRRTAGGAYIWVEMVATIMSITNGQILVASEREVTQERAARDAASLATQERNVAEAAQAAHEETLGYACHELRNPLHVINASVDCLIESLSSQTTSTDQQHMSAIRISAQQMRTLVDDIMDVERLRAGSLTIKSVPFSPQSLLQDMVHHHMEFARVPVYYDAALDVPPVVVAPAVRIQQVLNNGLTNAAKFCGAGAIRVRVMCGSVANSLRFEVRNTGAAPTQPLFRNLRTTAETKAEPASSTIKGSGLGLRISASLVHAMGGSLQLADLPVVEPLPGCSDTHEATLWFQIPYTRDVPARRPSLGTPTARSSTAPAPTLDLKVLYADDEVLNRRIAQNMLNKLGCTCQVVDDGDQVMSSQPESFDVILLDIIMQRVRGDEVVKQIRAAGITVPCIAVTGNADAASATLYLAAGFDLVIAKPFSIADMRAALIRHVHH